MPVSRVPSISPAAPAPAPITPLEYDGASTSGGVSQLDVAPPLGSHHNGGYGGPLPTVEVYPEPRVSQDDWFEPEPIVVPRRRDGFTWRERDWRLSYWRRRLRDTPALIAGITILLASLVLGFVVAGRIARSVNVPTSAAQAAPGGVVIGQVPTERTPTPTDAASDLGIWVSNPTPGTSGTIQVFVRLTSGLQPDARVPVSIYVQYPGSSSAPRPAVTDKYGLATFTLTYAGLPPHAPVFITASATIAGHTITAETSFVPA